MTLSLSLAQQILSMFLTIAVGYVIVKIGLFQSSDSKMLSNLIVYIFSPCVVVDSFQIELTQEKLKGLFIALVVGIIAHIVMITGTKLLSRILHFNRIEKASLIYTNCGYLVIPLVGTVLGKEWVLYTTPFIVVQTVLMWTHCSSLISGKEEKDYIGILLNPNIIAMIIGLVLFVLEVKLPYVIGSCVTGFGNMISPASMLVIGMVIGNVDLKWVFAQKRPYLICFIRMILYPLLAAVLLGLLGSMGIHTEAEYILLVTLLQIAAPVGAMVTQMTQIYDKDSKYASVLNVMSVIFCIITMPAIVMLYERFY